MPNLLLERVLSRKQKSEIFDRIERAWHDLGFKNRAQFVEALNKAGTRLTGKSLSSYSSGRAAPGAETIIGIAKLTKTSIDYLLTGEEPPPPSIAELLEIVKKSAAAHGHAVEPLDAETEEIMNYLLTADAAKRKLLVELVRNLKGKE